MTIKFFVAGPPQPRGSKRAFPVHRKNGKLGVSVSDANPNSRNWMAQVSIVAQAEMNGRAPLSGPVSLRLSFTMPRPKSHYRRNSEVKPAAPCYHTSAPDCSKLARGVEDALTNIVYADDAQIVASWTEKRYGERPGVTVEVSGIEDDTDAGREAARHSPRTRRKAG